MSEPSLSYYVAISKGNAELLKTFKTLLLEDFKSMELNFFSAANENNISSMRAELHKMYPIATNLKFSQMLALIESYRNGHPNEFPKLHTQLELCFIKIYDLLKSE